jgi:hypothetical protein
MSKQATVEPVYVIKEIKLVNSLTGGAQGSWFKNGEGYDIEVDDARNGYWLKSHRGPKWWTPSTNVSSVLWDVT